MDLSGPYRWTTTSRPKWTTNSRPKWTTNSRPKWSKQAVELSEGRSLEQLCCPRANSGGLLEGRQSLQTGLFNHFNYKLILSKLFTTEIKLWEGKHLKRTCFSLSSIASRPRQSQRLLNKQLFINSLIFHSARGWSVKSSVIRGGQYSVQPK